MEFAGRLLQRVVAYVNHPSALYFHPSSARVSSKRFDSACNFFLSLTVKSYDPIVLDGLSFTFRPPQNSASAPIAQLWRYVALKRQKGWPPFMEEHDSSFLSRAKGYLGKGLEALIQNKESIAKSCVLKMEKNAFGTENKLTIGGSRIKLRRHRVLTRPKTRVLSEHWNPDDLT
ncbi:hypothetical protein F5B21DRAFT_109978 [Xylaria acuta]|nr:hypothetical protein F5B21DRAFT_109978 [Xylaria acuta]